MNASPTILRPRTEATFHASAMSSASANPTSGEPAVAVAGRSSTSVNFARSFRRGLSELPAGHRTVGEQRSHLVETHPQHSGLTPERTNILAVVRGQQQPRIGPAKPFDH